MNNFTFLKMYKIIDDMTMMIFKQEMYLLEFLN